MGTKKNSFLTMKFTHILLILAITAVVSAGKAKKAGKGRRRLDSCQLSKNGRCGSGGAQQYCNPGAFCSRFSWCGIGAAWSAHSSNSKYDGTAACVKAQQLPESRTVLIENKNSGKVMDVKEAKFEKGNWIWQFHAAGVDNQKFMMHYKSKTTFILTPANDQKLSVVNDGKGWMALGDAADE